MPLRRWTSASEIDPNRRRDFIGLFGNTAEAYPLAVHAQTAAAEHLAPPPSGVRIEWRRIRVVDLSYTNLVPRSGNRTRRRCRRSVAERASSETAVTRRLCFRDLREVVWFRGPCGSAVPG